MFTGLITEAVMAVTKEDIRAYFRDYPAENLKYLEEFFTDEEISFAMRFADDLVKTTPPLNIHSSDQIPDYIMLLGISAMLLQIKLNNLAINSTAGVVEHGVQLGIGDEFGHLQALQGKLMNDFMNFLVSYKRSVDFRNSLGSIKSPYSKKGGGCGGLY